MSSHARTAGCHAGTAACHAGTTRCHAGRRGAPRRLRAAALFSPALILLVLVVLAGAAAFGLAGCSLESDSSSLPGVGEAATNDTITVTLHSLDFYDEVTADSGDPITPTSKQDVFIVADLTIRNDKGGTLQVDPEAIRLVRDDGDYATAAGPASTSIFPKDYKPLKARPLRPGKKVRGMVAWALPKGTVLDELVVPADPDVEIGLGSRTVQAPAPKKPAHVGQTVKGGGISLKVKSVTYPASLTHGLWTTTAKKGSKMVVVDLTVKNLDYRPSFKTNPMDVVIIDNKGKQHISGLMVLGLADSAEFQMKRLKPGASESGKVVISLKKNLKVKRIRYAVGVMGPPLETAPTK